VPRRRGKGDRERGKEDATVQGGARKGGGMRASKAVKVKAPLKEPDSSKTGEPSDLGTGEKRKS